MKSWLRAWKKAWASRVVFDKSNASKSRERRLGMEFLESRELLSIVSVVAKDPYASEEPVGGQTDPGQFVVVRDTVTSSPLTVRLKLSGNAMFGMDYASGSGFSWDSGESAYVGTVTIPADSASQTLDITPVNDVMKESTKTVTATVLTWFMGGGYSIGVPGSDSIALVDNDDFRVKIEATDAIAGERASAPWDPGQFTVTRFGCTDLSMALNVSVTASGAMYGFDYTSTPGLSGSPPTGTVTIPAGSTTATIAVNINDDMMQEGTKAITFSLNSGMNYTPASPNAASVMLTDNDGSSAWNAKIEAVQGTATEPISSSGTGTPARFKVTRYNATDASQAITVNYSVSGTATSGTDYSALSGSVTIPASQTEALIDVVPSYDGLNNDNNETVIVTLTSGSGYSVGSPSSSTALIDDSGAGSSDSEATTGQLGGDSDGALKLAVADTDLVWLSTTDPRPIVSADVKLQPTNGQATLSTVEASLTLGGVQSGTVYYNGSTANGTDLYRFSLQVDASSLATGRYDWSITITQRYSDQSTKVDTYTGQRDIVNRATSPYGKSWNLRFLDRLYQNSRGVLLVRGDGGTAFFNNTTTSGQYAPEAGHPEFDKLLGDWTNGFTLAWKDKASAKFNAQGILTSSSDSLGNTTTYSYTDADSDGQTDDPSQITDAANRTTTFSYTSGRLSSITDFASRATTLGYDGSGRLTSVTLPDPDGGGPLASPVWQFGYNATTHLLTSQTDPANKTTSYAYDFARTLHTITHPNSETDTLRAVQVRALVDTGSGQGSQGNPAGLFRVATIEGSREDELDRELFFTTGRFARVTSTTDAAGNVTTLEYNEQGLLTRQTLPDPDGAGPLTSPVTQYQYDSNGNLTQITLPDNATQTWTYNTTFNKPTSFTDELGHQTLYTLDANTGDTLSVRQVVGQVDPQGGESDDLVTSYTYSPKPGTTSDPRAGLVTTTTDPLGRVTRTIYNAHGLATMVVYAVGTADQAVVQYGYNASDDMTSYTDELGRTTNYAYDTLHRVTSITQPDPDGGGPLSAPVTTYEYDARGLMTKETDPLNRDTQYTYNDLGRLTQVSKPDHDNNGQRTNTSYAYTATGQLYTTTDPLGRVTTNAYNTLDRLTSVTQPDPDGGGPLTSPVTQYAYDNLGRLTQVTDALSRVTTFEYNSRGWRTKMTQPDPDGAGPLTAPIWQYGYNSVGNQTTETDPLSNVTTRAYDALNRLSSLTQPDPDGGGPLTAPVTTYGYDKAGNLLSLADPVSNDTTWTYDARNRQITETNELSQSRSFVYDRAGQLIKRTDRNGRLIEYTFDNLGRQTAELWKNGETTIRTFSYAFDAANQLTSAGDSSASYTYSYDVLGNMASTTQTITGLTPSVGITQTFDAASQRTQAAFAFGTTNDMVNNYTFDNLGRMTQVQQSSQTGGNAVAPKRVDFAFDAAKQFSTITRYANLAGTQLVATSTYTYDNASRLTALSHTKGANTLAGYTWSFDSAGRVTQFVSTTDGTANYSYDNTDQVTGATYNYQTNESYSYDANGNRTNTGYSTGSDNRLTSDGTYRYTYDAEGNRTAKFVDVNTNGQLDTGDTNITEYTWDYRNRLTNVTERATYGGATTKVTDFAYDYLNRLVIEAADPDGAGAQGAQNTYYAYDGNQIVLKFNGSSASNLANRYLWGPAIDQILADEQVTSLNNPGSVLWPLGDNLGTVRDLLTYDSQTDTTTVANHRVFDAYGKLTSETNSAVDHLFGFTGRQFDEGTGLQNNLNRWYDAAVGRWLSQDPIGFRAADQSLYRYVRNAPNSTIDPTGLCAQAPQAPPPVDDPEFWKKVREAYEKQLEQYKKYMDKYKQIDPKLFPTTTAGMLKKIEEMQRELEFRHDVLKAVDPTTPVPPLPFTPKPPSSVFPLPPTNPRGRPNWEISPGSQYIWS
jgi:RHS repeat-associated protein